MKEAMDVYLFSKLDNITKVDRSLELTNRALELDGQNIQALTHKTTLLFIKKDIDGLIKAIDNLIKLWPENPHYLAQKGLYLELKGDDSKANEYYDSALSKTQKHLKNDSLDFNLLMGYISMLEISGDTTSASEALVKMEKMNFDDSQREILRVYKTQVHPKQSLSKEIVTKYWNGEITYEQVEEILEGK